MLSPGFQEAGIGVYCAPDGSIWATTEFARPTSSGAVPAGVPRRHAAEPRRPARRRLAHLRALKPHQLQRGAGTGDREADDERDSRRR